jgi:hypothetical protein
LTRGALGRLSSLRSVSVHLEREIEKRVLDRPGFDKLLRNRPPDALRMSRAEWTLVVAEFN